MDSATTPAPSLPESATRIRTASPLVLAAMEHGFSAAEAIALVEARAAETTRLANLLTA